MGFFTGQRFRYKIEFGKRIAIYITVQLVKKDVKKRKGEKQMKSTYLKKKINLNKTTIANLNRVEMDALHGGTLPPLETTGCDTCGFSCTCPTGIKCTIILAKESLGGTC